MSEHKTGKSNWTPEQKERYWTTRKQIAALSAQDRRAFRRFVKYGAKYGAGSEPVATTETETK